MQKSQEERMRELLDKYTKFIHQKPEDKIKLVRLCGILAYLEAVDAQGMTIQSAIKNLEKFLDKVVVDYTGGDDTNGKKETEGRV
jgi:hypothetical protein